MILIADCGSTKTDWALCDNDTVVTRIKTQGFNPTQQNAEEIFAALSTELEGQIGTDAPQAIYFYGAGCAYESAIKRMHTALSGIFATKEIYIYSDLLAAARALCGHDEGIACILGTGSNSCLFDCAKSRTRRNILLAIRGVPRLRRAISMAPASSMGRRLTTTHPR